MNRRSFLKAILLAASAPAIVRYSSLMPLRGIDPREAICSWRMGIDLSAVADQTAIWYWSGSLYLLNSEGIHAL